MRHTFDTIDPLPAFPSDGIAFELVDCSEERAFVPTERMRRLPSWREVREQAMRDFDRQQGPKLARAGWIGSDTKQSIEAIDAFNGNVRPEITEADCRKRVEQPKQAPAEQPAATPQFKVGDRVRITDGLLYVGECGVVDEINDSRVPCRVAVNNGVPVWKHAEHLELLPSEQPKADADGWVDWDASKRGMPRLSGETKVALRCDDGTEVWTRGIRVGSANWAADSIIRAYRVLA